jgi:prepilin-type N-terminal cleavage/methylation domain-containing protein
MFFLHLIENRKATQRLYFVCFKGMATNSTFSPKDSLMSSQKPIPDKHGFTLVEILVVIVILGVLGAIVIPMFSEASAEAQQNTFAACLKTFSQAATYYEVKTGEYPADAGCGQCPAGWEDYINVPQWKRPTPVGGLWDVQFNKNDVTCAVGVHFHGANHVNPGDAYMLSIDAVIDNGDLETGAFQKIASDRYYMIIAP